MYGIHVNWLSDEITEVPISISLLLANLLRYLFLVLSFRAAQFSHDLRQANASRAYQFSLVYLWDTLYLIMHSGNRFHSLYHPWNAIRHANLSYCSQSTVSGSLKRQYFYLPFTCKDHDYLHLEIYFEIFCTFYVKSTSVNRSVQF